MTDRICTISGCTRKHEAHGLCQPHYLRQRRGQALDAPIRRRIQPTGPCSTAECDGSAEISGMCRRHYDLDYRVRVGTERRDAWIAEQGGVCAECGSDGLFEIDHIDPASKTLEVAAIWLRRQDVRDRELAKCQVLCAPCHRAKTANEQQTHGLRGYRRGCRCGTCATAMQHQLDRAAARRKAA